MKKLGELGISPTPWRADYDFWLVDVSRVELTNVIELIDITEAAAKSIAEVPEWAEH